MRSTDTQRGLLRELAAPGALLLAVLLAAGYGLTVTWGWNVPPVVPADSSATAAAPAPILRMQPLPPTPLPPTPLPETPLPETPEVRDTGLLPAPPRPLRIPVEGVRPGELLDSFDDPRSGGRRHEAIDIMAPRGTPVRAAAGGAILRLHRSAAGGRSVYQLSRDSSRVYYYAHLAAYAEGLAAGDRVRRGQVLGTVGTSGNAPADAPHLHFAVWKVEDPESFWDGPAVNPYPLF